MRLSRVTFETEPPATITLHPRLTVVVADAPTRARIVQALDRLLRGRAATLHGTLAENGVTSEFVVASSAGPVLPGVPTIVRAHDLDASAGAVAATNEAGALARYEKALTELRGAEDAQGEALQALEALRHQRAQAVEAVDRLTRDGTAPDDCRREVRAYVEELEVALSAATLPDSRRVELLERGTVLVADAARLGVCRPQTVRELLDAVDSLSRAQVGTTPFVGRNGKPVVSRAIMAELESPPPESGARASETLVRIEDRLQAGANDLAARERAVNAARSRALAVYAELEAVRRSTNRENGTGYAAALRARLGRRVPATWVGVPPIILDDVLSSCPPEEIEPARTVLLQTADRAQVIYVTGDPDTHDWARRFTPDQGALAFPTDP